MAVDQFLVMFLVAVGCPVALTLLVLAFFAGLIGPFGAAVVIVGLLVTGGVGCTGLWWGGKR